MVVLCFMGGAILRHTGRIAENAPQVINTVIIYISLPALVLLQIHSLEFQRELLFTVAMPWLTFGLAIPFFLVVGKLLKLDRATVGCLILLGGMGNTSFIGLPMIDAFYGSHMLAVGIIADQAGSFLVLSTAGIVTAGIFSSRANIRPSAIARKILTFPPAIAAIVALLLRPIAYPLWWTDTLSTIGSTVPMLAMVSVGTLFTVRGLRGLERELALGLGFKMLLAPLAIFVLFVLLLGGRGEIVQVTIFEAAMPPMIVGGILAMEYGLRPQLVPLLLGVGIVFSFITLPLWWLALGWV